VHVGILSARYKMGGAHDQNSDAKNEVHATLLADMKVRQALKIQELGQALISAGFVTLDEQAKALGIPRSTAWTIVKARHKNSGLSPRSVKLMLASEHLPPLVRSKIIEYGEEKVAGLYGRPRRGRPDMFREGTQ
jgi:hypothetical protein